MRQNINIGAAPNDGSGDTLRVGGQKINDNFIELYNLTGGKLTILSQAVWAANQLMYMTGPNSVAMTSFPAQARTFLAAATQAAQRTALGLGTVALDNVVPIARGGTGATTIAEAQAALGLVPITSASDFTADRVALVGFAGWGGNAPSNQDIVNQQSSLFYDTSLAVFPIATPIINVRGTRSMAWAARGGRSWAYSYGETPVLMEHWTDKNLSTTTSYLDTTPGSVAKLDVTGRGFQGLGNTVTVPVISSFENLKRTCLGLFTTGTPDRPAGFTNGGFLNIYANSADAGYQVILAGGYTANQYALGRVQNGGPPIWSELWHSNNMPRQTSVTDATPGAVTINGSWGLGGAGIPRSSIAQTNLTRGSEFFINGGNADVSPFPIGYFAGIHASYGTNGYAVQFIGGVTANRYMARYQNNGAWQPSVEFWHTSNLTPNQLNSYTLASLPSATANPRLMVWVSNLTGGAKPCYSDGTTYRRMFDNSAAN